MSAASQPTRRNKRIWIIVAVVAIIVVVVGSVAYAANRPGTAPSPPTGPNVTIWDTGFCGSSSNCGYSPTSKDITQGTNITWTNTGGQPHTVTECTTSDSATACPNGVGSNTSTSRAFDSNTQFSGGFRNNQQVTFGFNFGTGTYYYYCSLHPWMHGTIVVS